MTTHETDRDPDVDPPEDEDEVESEDAELQEAAEDRFDETVEDDDSVEEEGDSVLLTETEPGSVLPPEVEEDVEDQPKPVASPLERLEPGDAESPLDPGTGDHRERWSAIQTGFIDDPRRSVESASSLLVEMWTDIERSIDGERQGIDDRWRETDASTDDLRLAMQSYRDLYTRLAAITSTDG